MFLSLVEDTDNIYNLISYYQTNEDLKSIVESVKETGYKKLVIK